jgi:hypothetical protein
MAKRTTTSTGSPFPARFASVAATVDHGLNPGELLPFNLPKRKTRLALADFFPASETTAIQTHGSISFRSIRERGKGTPEQHDVADMMGQDVNTKYAHNYQRYVRRLTDGGKKSHRLPRQRRRDRHLAGRPEPRHHRSRRKGPLPQWCKKLRLSHRHGVADHFDGYLLRSR